MTIAESRRLALFESAKISWGQDPDQTLMDYLPFDPDAHATKADVSLMKADISLVRGELAVFDANLRTEIAQLGGDLRAEMGQQTRTLVLALVTIEVTILLAVLGVVLAA